MLQRYSNINELVSQILSQEESLIEEMKVRSFLEIFVADGANLKSFAEIFYFIRTDFCGLNFMVGERCHSNERLWAGLVRNLVEELGERGGQSHNQLYKNFLSSVNTEIEPHSKSPKFAENFNALWRNFAKTAPLMESLSAIAIYEIFDIPDYQMFLDILTKASVSEKGLHFFRVHANAHHFAMFEDTIVWLMEQDGGEQAFANANKFVFDTQRAMWAGLIECLQHRHHQRNRQSQQMGNRIY
jgi:pyrroloquinoline quinone (PQQ) biosynthesis protein C